jgi:hypothetical protein
MGGWCCRPMLLIIRPTGRLLHVELLICTLVALTACTQPSETEQQPADSEFFVPRHAENIKRAEQRGTRGVSYVTAEPYPASQFLCELTTHLEEHGWRGLRGQAVDPGSPSSLVAGWHHFIDGSRQPEARVHGWMAEWLNQQGDLLFYALRYEYPHDSVPALSMMNVVASRIPADLVRSQLTERADQLRALILPAARGSLSGDGEIAAQRCAEPQWSEFVRRTVEPTTPVAGLPSELAQVRSIHIQADVAGIAARVAGALTKQVPALQVTTVHDRPSDAPDARLNFTFECRCNEPGAPKGFYVSEVVLYTRPVALGWNEPARVLFHWSDHGQPPWKQVPETCFGDKTLTSACKEAFEQADIAFAGALASALVAQQRQP